MLERIRYNTMLEGTDDKGAIHLLINSQYTMGVVDTVSSIRNTSNSTRLVFFETNARDYQYKTEAAIDHYLWQDNASSCI